MSSGEGAAGPVESDPGGPVNDRELAKVVGDEVSSASATILDGCFFGPPLRGGAPGYVFVAFLAAFRDAPKSYRLPKAWPATGDRRLGNSEPEAAPFKRSGLADSPR